MTTRQKLIVKCRELGCMLSKVPGELIIDPPAGKVFRANDCHELHYGGLDRGGKAGDAYAELLEQLNLGIEDCTVTECEICEEAATFEEIIEVNDATRIC